MKTRKLKSAGPTSKRKHSQEANTSQEKKPRTRSQRRKPSQAEIHEPTQETKLLSRSERRKQLALTERKKHTSEPLPPVAIQEPSPVVTREPSPPVVTHEPSPPVVTRERPRPPYQNTQRYINCLQNDLSKIWEEKERFKPINKIDLFFSELQHNNKESYVNFFIFEALKREDYSADKIKSIFNTNYSSNILFIRENITHDYYNIKYNLNIGRITLYISIHGYTKNKTIILHFNDNEELLDYDSDIMYKLLSEYKVALCEIEQIGLSHGVDREIIHNFDHYDHIMNTFNELLKRCIEQKKT